MSDDAFQLRNMFDRSTCWIQTGDLVIVDPRAKNDRHVVYEALGSFDPFSVVSECDGIPMIVLGEGGEYRCAAPGTYDDFGFGGGENYGREVTSRTLRCLCGDKIKHVPMSLLMAYQRRDPRYKP